MLSNLMSALFNVLVFLGLIWIALALLSAKWPVWRSLRRGYLALLRALLLGVARFLWSPEFPREGGGQALQRRGSIDAEETRWD